MFYLICFILSLLFPVSFGPSNFLLQQRNLDIFNKLTSLGVNIDAQDLPIDAIPNKLIKLGTSLLQLHAGNGPLSAPGKRLCRGDIRPLLI